MNILAIETSCDETGIALIQGNEQTGAIDIVANLVRSQAELHVPYGGVFPSLAKREHQKALPALWKQLKASNTIDTIDRIAVTQGPGLSPCLWQGITFAQERSKEYNTPLFAINHLKGHVYIAYPGQTITHPTLSLIVSGGHAELVFSEKPGAFEIIGRTRDDAAGEAFDKVARLLGLGYPGGPEISRVAKNGNPERFDLPRPMMKDGTLDFSFAGLKTAVMYHVKGIEPARKPVPLTEENVADLAASFQQAAVDVLVEKTIRAAKINHPRTLILGGGVAANAVLRETLQKRVTEELPESTLILPDRALTTDNALMIALAAWYERDMMEPVTDIAADPNLRIDA